MPADIPNIPEIEALRLAIYFEETGAYQYRQRKDMERQASSSGSNPQSVEEVIPDDEDDEYE